MRRTRAADLTRVAVLFLLAVFLGASNARAELVFFSTGRVMSVKGHRVDGERVVLLPRDGGEMVCAASLVARIEPDEVPYPEEVRLEPDAFLDSALDSETVRAVRLPFTGAQGAQPDLQNARYDPIIDKASAEQGVDARLVRAVIQVESGYRERAQSPKGAMGLMQLMPDTVKQYAVTNPYDPTSNIEAGIKHLKSLLDRFPVSLALAAYNAGTAAVERFRGVPPYEETRDYVSRILQLASR